MVFFDEWSGGMLDIGRTVKRRETKGIFAIDVSGRGGQDEVLI